MRWGYPSIRCFTWPLFVKVERLEWSASSVKNHLWRIGPSPIFEIEKDLQNMNPSSRSFLTNYFIRFLIDCSFLRGKKNLQLQLSERLKFPHVCSEVHRYSSWVAGRLRTIVRYEQSKHWMKLVMGRIRNEIGKLSQLWTSFVKKEIAILNNDLGLLTLQNRRKSVN